MLGVEEPGSTLIAQDRALIARSPVAGAARRWQARWTPRDLAASVRCDSQNLYQSVRVRTLDRRSCSRRGHFPRGRVAWRAAAALVSAVPRGRPAGAARIHRRRSVCLGFGSADTSRRAALRCPRHIFVGRLKREFEGRIGRANGWPLRVVELESLDRPIAGCADSLAGEPTNGGRDQPRRPMVRRRSGWNT